MAQNSIFRPEKPILQFGKSLPASTLESVSAISAWDFQNQNRDKWKKKKKISDSKKIILCQKVFSIFPSDQFFDIPVENGWKIDIMAKWRKNYKSRSQISPEIWLPPTSEGDNSKGRKSFHKQMKIQIF